MSVIFLVVVLFALLIVGAPVAIALGVSAFLTTIIFTSHDVLAMPEMMVAGLKPALMAIPMFVLAGLLMSRGGSAQRIIDFAKSLVGHLPGGLPISAILACVIFAAISGSSPATVIAIGSVMFAALKNANYPNSYAIGAITSAGALGILIPPSITMIVYGVTGEVSIEKLFMAGVVPGLMIAGVMMLYAYVGARRLGFKATKSVGIKEQTKQFKKSFWALLIVFVVIGGIYAGIFTATEAAGISAVYALIISLFIYKDLKFSELYSVFLEAAITTAQLFLIIGFAVVFAHFLTTERIPHLIAQSLIAADMSWWMFLIFVNIALFIMGQFMEPSSIVMIMTPLLLPIAVALGIDPVHFGIIMVVNMEIGMLTPPIGLNLFVASSLTKLSIKEVTYSVLPWLCLFIICIILITYIPQISLFLPNMLGK